MTDGATGVRTSMRSLSFKVNRNQFQAALRSLSSYAAKFNKASTQIDDVPKEVKKMLKDITKGIGKGLLGKYGIEDKVHITLLYGIEATPDEVKEFFTEPLKLKTRDKIEYFDNYGKDKRTDDEGTVAIIRIDSKELKSLHNRMKKKIKNDHVPGEYKPHLTLAYLKPGCRLPIEELKTFSWKVNEIVYSDKNGKKTKIKLKS